MRSRAVTRRGLALAAGAPLLTALAVAAGQEKPAAALPAENAAVPTSRLTSSPASQAGTQPTSQPTSQPASQAARQTASQPTSQAAKPPTSQPARKLSSPGATQQPSNRLIESLGLGLPGSPKAAPAQTAGAGTDVRLSRPGTFEIHVQGADLRGVLQLLSTQGRKNIVATKEVTGTVTADLYGVTFTEALEAVLKASGFVYREKDGFIYVYTAQQLDEVVKSERKMGQRIFRLAYITAADAKTLIAPVLSSEAKISMTPAAPRRAWPPATATRAATATPTTTSSSSRTTRTTSSRSRRSSPSVDVRPDQVLVEVTMLGATLDEENNLGVNFSTLAGIDFETLGSTSTKVGSMTDAGMSGTKLDNAPAASFRTDFTTATSGLTIGMVTNNVAAFITALESITDTTVLANPKLLIVNKQRGEVMVGKRDGYITTTVTEGQVTQSVEFLETGTRLIVRPYVAKDGFVRLELHPEDSDGGVDRHRRPGPAQRDHHRADDQHPGPRRAHRRPGRPVP